MWVPVARRSLLLALLVTVASSFVAPHRTSIRVAPSSAEPSVWQSMKNEELKAHLRRRGLAVSGNKTALVARLTAAEADAATALKKVADAKAPGRMPEAAPPPRRGFIDGSVRDAVDLDVGGVALACHVASTRLVAQERAAAPGAGGKCVLLLPDLDARGKYDLDECLALADRLAFDADALVVAPAPEDLEAYAALEPAAVLEAARAAHAGARAAGAAGVVAFGRFADRALAAGAAFDAVVAWRPAADAAALGRAAARAEGAPLVVLGRDAGAAAAALRAGFDAGPAADYVVHVADASSLDPLDEASDAALLAVAWLQLYLVREQDRTTGPRARALWVDE